MDLQGASLLERRSFWLTRCDRATVVWQRGRVSLSGRSSIYCTCYGSLRFWAFQIHRNLLSNFTFYFLGKITIISWKSGLHYTWWYHIEKELLHKRRTWSHIDRSPFLASDCSIEQVNFKIDNIIFSATFMPLTLEWKSSHDKAALEMHSNEQLRHSQSEVTFLNPIHTALQPIPPPWSTHLELCH